MKDYLKYIISTVIFFATYVLLEYLFDKNINWETIMIATILYAILNTGCNMLFNKKLK